MYILLFRIRLTITEYKQTHDVNIRSASSALTRALLGFILLCRNIFIK